MTTNCPKCNHSDSIQKISAIVSSGTSSGSYYGPTTSVGRVNNEWAVSSGVTSLTGSSSTNLASLLAPPPPPIQPGGMSLGCLIPLLFVSIGITISSINLGELTGLLIGVPILLITISYHVNKLTSSKETFSSYKPLYANAVRKWNNLYYCHRDDIVFDPDTQKYVSPSQLQDFIFTQ